MNACAYSGRVLLAQADRNDPTAPPAAAHEPVGASAGAGSRALVASNIVVELDETKILREASLSVDVGEIHALIGPNGAGKTTLANVLTGHVKRFPARSSSTVRR